MLFLIGVNLWFYPYLWFLEKKLEWWQLRWFSGGVTIFHCINCSSNCTGWISAHFCSPTVWQLFYSSQQTQHTTAGKLEGKHESAPLSSVDAFSSAPSVSLNTNWSLGLRVSVCLMILSPRYTRNRICIGNLLSGDFLTEEVRITKYFI